MIKTRQEANAALNRVCKWRIILSGRWLGILAKSDPRAQAARDLFEKLIILRCEVTALSKILIEKKVMTVEEFDLAIGEEAELLDMDYAKAFPGIEATDYGIAFVDIAKAQQTMKDWPK